MIRLEPRPRASPLLAVGARVAALLAALLLAAVPLALAGAPLLTAYRERCDTIGRVVRVDLPHGGPLEGLAVGVAGDGALLVRPAGADPDTPPRPVHAGDVVHVRGS